MVGVQGDDEGMGSVRVYVNSDDDGFKFQALLVPSDGAANDDFGRAVAVSGNFIIVGAQKHDADGENSGAAYIYERTVNVKGEIVWTQVTKLIPLDPQTDERFGISVSIHGKVAIVGANGDDSNGQNSGSAYVFTLDPNVVGEEKWMFKQKLEAPDGAAGDNFGFSVSNYGNHAVVGAVWANEKSGSAYVFLNQGGAWTTQGKFEGTKPSDQFGWSVSIYKDTIAVGAVKYDDRTIGPQAREILDRGSVTLFVTDEEGSWYKQARLEPGDGNEGDHFGRCLDLHEDWLIVSAPYNDEMGMDAGTAYIYQRESEETDGWLLQTKVFPNQEDAVLNEYGFSVGVSNENFVVTSKYLNQETGLLGNTYIYSTRNPNEPTASPTLSYPPTKLVTMPPTSQNPSNVASENPTTDFPTFSSATAPSNEPSVRSSEPQNMSYIPTDVPTKFEDFERPSSMPSVEGQTKMPTYPPTPETLGLTEAPSMEGQSKMPTTEAVSSTDAPSVVPQGETPNQLTPTPTPFEGGTVNLPPTSGSVLGLNTTSAPTLQ